MEAGYPVLSQSIEPEDLDIREYIDVEESQTIVDRFREHADHDTSYFRKCAVKAFPDVLNAAKDDEIDGILNYISVFSRDIEDYVKMELYEKLELIMDSLINRYGHSEPVVESIILPSIIGNLTNTNSQVRRTCQETLLSFIEKNIITKSHVEDILWHVIYEMSEEGINDEFRCDSIYMMIKVAHLMGPSFTEANVLPRFFELCSHQFFNLRKICATNFGEISAILNRADTAILSKLSVLCEDVVWGVRKACAEAIPQISKYCSVEDRYNCLTDIYCKLLEDSSRWVRIASYQQLGYFIATFAGTNYPSEQSTEEAVENPPVVKESGKLANEKVTEIPNPTAQGLSPSSDKDDIFIPGKRSRTVSNSYDVSSDDRLTIKVDNSPEFNSLNFWRVPLPELDLELEMEEGRPKSINITSRVVDSKSNKVYKSAINLDLENDGNKVVATQSQSSEILNLESLKNLPSEKLLHHSISDEVPHHYTEESSPQCFKQNVVPESLMSYYLKMTEPEIVALDVDMPRHCAFCFPAVLYTLGAESWPSLKSLYECLSRDLQWKVRRTLAFSFHEVANTLGPAITTSDLLIYFNEFVHDVDEVKTGIVANLAKLWRALNPELSILVLEQLSELNQVENDRNWRYRLQLTEQINELTKQLATNQIKTFVCPIAWTLLDDKVAVVRNEAFVLVANILKTYNETNFYELDNFVHTLNKEYGESSIWYKRQTFLYICIIIVDMEALSLELFSKLLLPRFLKIASEDPVANVRLVAARGLSRVFTVKGYFVIDTSLLNTLEALRQNLKSDHDRDVRQCANTENELVAEEALERVDLVNRT